MLNYSESGYSTMDLIRPSRRPERWRTPFGAQPLSVGLPANTYRARYKLSDAVEALAAIGITEAYDKGLDFSASLNVGYEAIRDRVANGGPGWERET